ncbi:unnamed protein product [Rotaria sordida]|uniref:Uncharacterized protein n=2 Tax=Rotaria sordida TaxID=392033 RepID=A0A819AL63_9BILA|nr:unnamed protein product [Rotaria sordida]
MFLTCQTNRTFSENYSMYTKDLFNRFQKYLHPNYEHLWTKNHQDMLISIKPQQIEFDILGFDFQHSSKEHILIESSNLEAIFASSSYSYLKLLNANTVIFAEFFCLIPDFHNDNPLICDKKNISSNLINTKRKKSSFKLFQKLLWLERVEHIPNGIQLIEAIKTKLHELKQIIIENNENEEECHRSKLLNDDSSSNSDAEQIAIALTSTHEVPLENLSNTPHQSDNENEEEQARQILLEQNNSSEHEDDDTILL